MKSLKQLLYFFKNLINPITENNPRLLLFKVALDCLGTDVTPKDGVPDDVACAEVVNAIHEKTFGFPIGGWASTYLLYQALERSTYFKKVDEPLEGDVVISPTGMGKIDVMVGHVGIVGELPKIMSNDSNTGLFSTKYTIQTWKERWVDKGGYPMHYFRRI